MVERLGTMVALNKLFEIRDLLAGVTLEIGFFFAAATPVCSLLVRDF